MDRLEIEVDLIGNLDDLMARVMERAEKATMAGAQRLIQEHNDLISDWSDATKPTFNVTDAVRSGSEVVREIHVDGWIWRWVNSGTKAVNIFGKKMRFPWEDPDTSYDSSYDPLISETWARGSGKRHGRDFATTHVEDRSIHPRRMDKKAIEQARDAVIAVMQSFFP